MQKTNPEVRVSTRKRKCLRIYTAVGKAIMDESTIKYVVQFKKRSQNVKKIDFDGLLKKDSRKLFWHSSEKEAQERALDNFHTLIYEVIKQATVKAFIITDVDELLDEKIHQLAEFQDFSKGLVRHRITLSILTLPVKMFLSKEPK